ncbi:MAG: hypothetical protein IKS99_05605 [Firmicutes bacterium]|nr:hypothetical protein [Bacillota bacterium]
MRPEEKIKKSILSGNISHAYIFEGSRVSGKAQVAESFLRAISGKVNLSACPDYYEVRAEAGQGRSVRSIKDGDMEELQANLKMKPQGDRNMALIRDADTMTVRAQNRFLKTLEEPTPGTVVIMLSENTENLLETIRSRCVIYRFYDNDPVAKADNAVRDIPDLIIDREDFHKIKKAIASGIKTREEAYAFLDLLENTYRDIMIGRDERSRLIGKEEAIRAIEIIEETRRALYGNAIVGYALKRMALRIQENQ